MNTALEPVFRDVGVADAVTDGRDAKRTEAVLTVTPPLVVVAVRVALSVALGIVFVTEAVLAVVPSENTQESVTPWNVGCEVLDTEKVTVLPEVAREDEVATSIVAGGSTDTAPSNVSRYSPRLP